MDAEIELRTAARIIANLQMMMDQFWKDAEFKDGWAAEIALMKDDHACAERLAEMVREERQKLEDD